MLAAQQKRLETVLANVPGIVWESIVGPNSEEQRIEFVNSYAERILGYTRDEWLSTPNFGQKIIHPDDLESSQKKGAKYLNAVICRQLYNSVVSPKTDVIVPIEAHYSILTDDTGK